MTTTAVLYRVQYIPYMPVRHPCDPYTGYPLKKNKNCNLNIFPRQICFQENLIAMYIYVLTIALFYEFIIINSLLAKNVSH